MIQLQSEEESKAKEEVDIAKHKAQSDIALVKRRLEEEEKEQREKEQVRRAERNAVRNKLAAAERKRLEKLLEQCREEAEALNEKEAEESRIVSEMQTKMSGLLNFVRTREAELLNEEKRLSSFAEECNEQIAKIRDEGEKKNARINNDKALLEVELDNLVANRPRRIENWAKEVDDLRAKNDGEITIAENKVRAMLESKKAVLAGASEKLHKLRDDTGRLDRELDEARKMKLLQPMVGRKESEDYQLNVGDGAQEGETKPKVGTSRIRQTIKRTLSKSLSKR